MRVVLFLVVAVCTGAGESFEVASISPSAPDQTREVIGTDPGSFMMSNVTLRRCIEWAYELPMPLQLTGPDWLNDVRFDISARAADRRADDDRLHAMLRSLLAERFGLEAHHERKEQRVYEMTLAKGGLKLHSPGGRDLSMLAESTTEGPSEFKEDKASGSVNARHVSMADLSRTVSRLLGAIVIDRTGVGGRFEFRLDLRPYIGQTSDGKDEARPDIMSILFRGLNEQLGLRLDATREAVDLVVIDSVNRTPTAN